MIIIKFSKKKVLILSSFLISFFLFFASETSASDGIDKKFLNHSYPKIVIIELDSLRKDILYETLNELPNISRIIRGENNEAPYIYLPTVETIIPSASAPANTSIYTGLLPSEHGVFCTTWFDRREEKIQTLTTFSQNRINEILEENGVATIFDYVKKTGKSSLVSVLVVSKGVEPKNWIKSTVFLWANSFWINLIKNLIPIPDPINMDRKATRGFLNGHIYSLSDGLQGYYRMNQTLPDLMVMHYFGLDIFSHYPHRNMRSQHWDIREIQTYYLKNVIDPEVGRIVQWLKKHNFYDDCIFFFIADHGMTHIKEHVDDDLIKEILSEEFEIRRRVKRSEVVSMPGAGTKAIYIKNRQTNSWESSPSPIKDMKVAVDLLLSNNELNCKLEFLLIKQNAYEEYNHPYDEKSFWFFDLHRYAETHRTDRDFFDSMKPLSLLDSIYSEIRLSYYFQRHYSHDTAPDILLVLKKGIFFAPNKRKYGHHGSIYPSDCHVSFILGGPGLADKINRRYTVKERGSVLDVVPTVGRLLNLTLPNTLLGKDIISEYCRGN